MKFSNQRRMLAGIACCAGLVWMQPAASQTYPDRPIKLVIGSSAGASVDFVARTYSEFLATQLGQPVVVENRPGANSEIGHTYAARAKPDGYTILLYGNNSLLVQLAGRSKLSILDDFAAISTAGRAPWALSVAAASPFKTIQEVVEYGRKEPGRLSYASIGGGIPEYMARMLSEQGKIDLLAVPYASTSDAKSDVLTQRVSLWFTALSSAAPLHAASQVRILGVSGESPPDHLKNVVTMRQAGFEALGAESTYYFLAPAETPAAIVDRLNKAINRAQDDPAVVAKLKTQGVSTYKGSADDTTRAIKAELAKWGRVIRPAPAN